MHGLFFVRWGHVDKRRWSGLSFCKMGSHVDKRRGRGLLFVRWGHADKK